MKVSGKPAVVEVGDTVVDGLNGGDVHGDSQFDKADQVEQSHAATLPAQHTKTAWAEDRLLPRVAERMTDCSGKRRTNLILLPREDVDRPVQRREDDPGLDGAIGGYGGDVV